MEKSAGSLYLKIPFLPLVPGVSLCTLGQFRSSPSKPKRISPAWVDICMCLHMKGLLLNNLPPAAIWANTLNKGILLDTKVLLKKIQGRGRFKGSSYKREDQDELIA